MNKETKLWDVCTEPSVREQYLDEAAAVLRAGGLVAFPTETVYGLGGNALDPSAAAAIYAAKGRPSDNPLIVHIAEVSTLAGIVRQIPPYAGPLMERFWPGPLTLIFRKQDRVPDQTTGGRDTVAVRLPLSQTARELIKRSGGYIAAPSANLSGRPSPTTADHVIRDMDGRIDGIICGEDCEIGLESTIIDCTGERPEILRPGLIDREQVEALLRETAQRKTLLPHAEEGVDLTGEARAPGMKYRHYAPRGSLYLLEGEPAAVRATMRRLAEEQIAKGETVGLIVCEEDIPYLPEFTLVNLGRRSRPDQIARHLYMALRRMDELGCTYILAPTFSGRGIGGAIMNRLKKAAGGRILICRET
ncbi:MAG: L-threonylcarbamoyladenylate synthase [Lachnospiraceae bacterium]|nr:L-threonylcarbamoyladenylate synthase [Lachnospiraceae bacterium]MDY5742661.1 L-threonylcarbamoyladenylate synthase [Lachnospiraceae bacterium]